TLATGEYRDALNKTIAAAASKVFGVTVPPANIIDETLKRVAAVPVPSGDALRAAVELPSPRPAAEEIVNHPLAAWTEEAFGLRTEHARLVRRPPETFAAAVKRLADETGLEPE